MPLVFLCAIAQQAGQHGQLLLIELFVQIDEMHILAINPADIQPGVSQFRTQFANPERRQGSRSWKNQHYH